MYFFAVYLKRISQNICSFSAIESYYNQHKVSGDNTPTISLQDFPLGFDTGGNVVERMNYLIVSHYYRCCK